MKFYYSFIYLLFNLYYLLPILVSLEMWLWVYEASVLANAASVNWRIYF